MEGRVRWLGAFLVFFLGVGFPATLPAQVDSSGRTLEEQLEPGNILTDDAEWGRFHGALEQVGWGEEGYRRRTDAALRGAAWARGELVAFEIREGFEALGHLERFFPGLEAEARGGDEEARRALEGLRELLPREWFRGFGSPDEPAPTPEASPTVTESPVRGSEVPPAESAERGPEVPPAVTVRAGPVSVGSPATLDEPEPAADPVASSSVASVDPGREREGPDADGSGRGGEVRVPSSDFRPGGALPGAPSAWTWPLAILLAGGLGVLAWGARRAAPGTGSGPAVETIRAALDQGRAGEALRSLDSLDLATLSPEETYALGRALEDAGVREVAREVFRDLETEVGGFRDVGMRLKALDGQVSVVPEGVLRGLATRYAKLAPLGRGGMGLAFRATELATGREVALKIPAPGVARDREARRRFLREARTLAGIEHPGVVRVYDVSAEDPLYFTMELLPGEDLAGLLAQEGRLAIDRIGPLFLPALEGLARVHEEGLVHRDLKPGNLFVDRDGALRLGDFGLARATEGTRLTATGAVVGTTTYAAPEQLLGEEVGPAVDVYAAGAVLFEALAGAPPFPAGEAIRKLSDPATSLAVAAPGTPPAIVDLVDRCLARLPGARPADGGALVDALRGALAGGGEAELRAYIDGLAELVAGPLHTLKNRVTLESGRGGAVEPAVIDAARAAAAALAPPAGLDAEARGDVEALVALLDGDDPAELARAHTRGRAALARFEVDVREVLDGVAAGYPGRCVHEGDGFPPPPLRVVDPAGVGADLALVLENLVANALEAGAATATLRRRTVDEAPGGAEGIEVAVIDDGPGFPDELRARALAGPLEDRGVGRGTGLWTAARAARRRGFELALLPGVPTTFRLRLFLPGEDA